MDNIQKLEQQADILFGNVAGWENSTLQRIGKRINKYRKLSLSDVKAINNIAVVKQDMDAITKELSRVTGFNISQIEQMYADLIEEQHLANQPLYDYRGKKFVPFVDNRELQAIVRAYAKTTGETMINLAKTKALCILDHNGKTKGLQRYYTDVLDKAVMQVSTGATDFHTAMRDTIVELGGSGVRVDYGGGVTRRLDTVVRQNLLWGAKQASVEYNEMVGEELGCDGIEIDWHSNPRPSHEFMQGKQYALGKARTINGVYFESADEALERLQDYGCLHFKTPIICGVSEPRFSPEELRRLNEQNARTYDIDGKTVTGYEATQMQRRLESAVREQKTIRDTAKASGDNLLVRRCNERIKVYQDKYNQISEITGIPKDIKRMSVPKSKNVLTNNTRSGTMKLAYNGENTNKKYVIKEDKLSVTNLEERIKNELGVSIVDFSELMNADVANEFIDVIEKLQLKHGQRFNSIVAQSPFNGAKDLAWVTPSRGLVINPEYFNSKDAMNDILDELYKIHLLPKGCKNIEYIATHEYAHLITMEEIKNQKSIVRTLFRRIDAKDFISQNAMRDPYEFASDYLAYKKANKTSQKLKQIFNWEDL